MEQEANLAAESALAEPGFQPEVSAGLARARIHADAPAARAAASLKARAFTLGRDVMFGAGQFRPETRDGRQLIAHELAHVAQQERTGRQTIQRTPEDVVEMPPLTVRGTLQPTERAISGLSNLRGEGVDPAEMSVTRDETTIARNAPDPTRRLPFATGGTWNAQDIMTALGQYDTLPGTDSDAIRCVQAVALASRIADGPRAVTGFLRAMILEGMMSRPMHPRQRTAIDTLEHVIGRVEMERATFGDLMWAQEALHDLFYNDVGGTPEPDILNQMAPGLEMGRTVDRMNVWANAPADVLTAAKQLQPGEQLLIETWQVVFNTAFEQISEQGIEVAEGRSITVRVNGRRVRIRRIPTDTRPAHTAIDPVRDHREGHQLVVLRDGATGQLRLYEPEVTETGRHLEDLAADGSNFARYFNDLPDVGIYNYIQIIGKLRPSAFAALQSPFAVP